MIAKELTTNQWEDAAYHFFIATITRHAGGGVVQDPDLLAKPTMVTFNVNGIDLPFEETLRDIYQRIHAEVDERALEMAHKIISAAGLEGVQTALNLAEYQIGCALDNALQQLVKERK